MQVAYRLQPRPEPAPADALLLLSREPADVLRLCADLGRDPSPRIHVVADGFLLLLDRPLGQPIPGTIRLRGLSKHLLVPVDADLVPGLLEDEAAALVRDRGLVFLPGGRVLEFSPGQPLPLSALLTARQVARPAWQPLPEPLPLADHLADIRLDLPEVPPDEVLAAGGEGVGEEQPRPEDAGMPARLLGNAAVSFGKGLAWLGAKFRMRGLARAGAEWMARGLSLAPRLSESLLGRQEAALRALLREFREGDPERALRRALPLGGNETPRGARPAGGAELPFHNLLYSLRDLLGGSSGPAGLWLNSADTYRELERAYREQAERALRHGDYRRAAFIYGKLLRDYSSAANALSRGGLHADAAVLFLAKLGDYLAAAREYEKAGAIDRALRLYRERGEHVLAAELLRRVGNADEAVAEYRVAARQMVAAGQGHYQAGEMLLTRAALPDLALQFYEAGWQRRPNDAFMACALRMAQLYARAGAEEKLLALAGEADRFLSAPGNDGPAADFYNELACLADEPGLRELSADLKDRALMGIALKLRQRAEAGTQGDNLVSVMLGSSPFWPAAVVNDARSAVKAARKSSLAAEGRKAAAATTVIRAHIPVVRAAVASPDGSHVFLGFESGEVLCYRPGGGEVVSVCGEGPSVLSLAASEDGDMVVILRGGKDGFGLLRSRGRTATGYREVASLVVGLSADAWLCPSLAGDFERLAGLWTGDHFKLLECSSFLPAEASSNAIKAWWHQEALSPSAGLLLRGPHQATPGISLLLFEQGNVLPLWREWSEAWTHRVRIGWEARPSRTSCLHRAPLTWLHASNGLEIAGTTPDGRLCWSALDFREDDLAPRTTVAPAGPYYLAAALGRPGCVAGVTDRAVHGLRRGDEDFRTTAVHEFALPNPIACFPHFRSNELIVVCADGTLARVACSW